MSDIAQMLQTYGGWGVSAVAITAWLWERRENKRLQQQVLDEAHATTELAKKNNETWEAASDLLRAIKDGLDRRR